MSVNMTSEPNDAPILCGGQMFERRPTQQRLQCSHEVATVLRECCEVLRGKEPRLAEKLARVLAGLDGV